MITYVEVFEWSVMRSGNVIERPHSMRK